MNNNKKVTKQEFEKWGQEFQNVAITALLYGRKERLIFQITGIGSLPTSNLCIEELIKNEAIFIKKGNIDALLTGLYNLENEPKANKTKKRPKLGGLSLNEWMNQIKKRLEEHCIAGGYYDPTKPLDLPELLAKKEKFEKLEKDGEYFSNLLSYMNAESLKIMTDIIEFNSQFKALNKYKNGGSEKSEKTKERLKKEREKFVEQYHFYFKDYLGRLEEAEQKWEEQKKKDNPPLPLPPVPSPTPSPTPPTPLPSPNSPSPLPKPNTPTEQERIEKIEKEKVQLEKKIKKMKKKLTDQQLDPTKKVEQKELLEKMEKMYQDLEKKKDKLEELERQNKSGTVTTKKFFFYLSWVIGGICLAVFIVWRLVQLRKRKKKK